MDIQEETFNISNNLLFLPSQEPNNFKEALHQSPGLRKLVEEYYFLSQEENLSPVKAKRMEEIFNLAVYDRLLDECIDNIQDSIKTIEQLECPKISIEEFINQVESTPAKEMTMEKFKKIAQRLDMSDFFLSNYIKFKSECYHRKVIFSTSSSCVFLICWEPGQETTNHKHSDSFSAFYVYQGTLTHRISREDNTLGKGYKLLKEKQFKENEWICVDSSQYHQLTNQSMENLITLHFRYFNNPDELMAECVDTTTNHPEKSQGQMIDNKKIVA